MMECKIEKRIVRNNIEKFYCWNVTRQTKIGVAYNFESAVNLIRGYMNEHYWYMNNFVLTINNNG